MKQWQSKTEVANFEDLTNPIVKAIKFAYTLKRKNEDKDIPYEGYDRPSMLHVCLGAKATLSAENLKYSAEEQGRDCLTELVSFAVQLGIEQGQRIEKEKNLKLLEYLDLFDDGSEEETLESCKSLIKFIRGNLEIGIR